MKMPRSGVTAMLLFGLLCADASSGAPKALPQAPPKKATAAAASEEQVSPEEKKKRTDWKDSMLRKAAPKADSLRISMSSN